MKQKPIPVRPYNRFMTIKVADSAVDQTKNLERFMMKEGSLDAYREDRRGTLAIVDSPVPKGQVPYGTTKCTYKIGLGVDARLDRYKLGIETHTFPKNPTDKFGGDPPPSQRPFQGLFDQMVRQPEFGKNSSANNPWVPKPVLSKSVNNRSGTNLNIITHEPNLISGVLRITTDITTNRLKGVTEFRDLIHPSAANENEAHKSAIAKNEKVFARKDGIFTHVYNSAARFGITKPFKA